MRWITGCLGLLVISCSSPANEGGAGSGGSAGKGSGSGGVSAGGSAGTAGSAGSTAGSAGTAGTAGMAGSAGSGGTGGVVVSVTPEASTVIVDHTLTLTATVTGSADTSVTWSVVESAGCGTVSATGTYTAPSDVPDPAFCHVQATSNASAQAKDSASLAISMGSTGAPGVWENVTPAEISLDQSNPGGGDNYGVQDVLADPARPSDLYAFVCYQGVWRSTDYGFTWTQANPGSNWGKPWGTAIDPNPARDPETAPALYAGGSNAVGFHRSTDFGVTWTDVLLPAAFGDYRYQQVYSVDVDPYDVDHVLVAFHEAPDVAESTDAGDTWTKFTTPAEDGGSSYYPFFINTGDAGTTHETWLTIPQQNGDARALRTTNGGTSWTKLNQFQHHHGSAQIFDAGAGLVYVAAMSPGGVHKSTDYGVSWTKVYDGDGGVVTATPNFLYSSVGFGWGKADAPLDPGLISAPRDDDDTWTKTTVPSGMVDGAKRMAVTYDGAHYVVVSGSWHAGIWRYVEP